MKLKKELLLVIIGSVLSIALIVSMIVIIVSATDNSHKGQNHEIEWQISVTPTYETEGLVTGKCVKCKKEFKEKLPVLSSDEYQIEITSDSRSCTQEKEANFNITILDNLVSVQGVIIKGENHSLDGMEITANDTRVFEFDEDNINPKINFFADEPLNCSEEGVKCYFKCDKCGESVIIHARKKHAPKYVSLDDLDVEFPNCTDSGTTEPFKCKYCSQTVQVTVPSRGHDYELVGDIKHDEASGTYTVALKCKRCGADDTKNNVKSYEIVEKVEPACGIKGKTTYALALSGGAEFKFTIYESALQHESIIYGVMDKEKYSILAYPGLLKDDVDESQIKCNSERQYSGEFNCVRCNQIVKVEVYRPHSAPAGTKWTDDTANGTKHRSYKCVDCGENVNEEIPASADHTYNYSIKKLSDGNYEATGVCIYCSDKKSIKLNADVVSVTVVKQATCKDEGKRVYTFKNNENTTCTAIEAIDKLPHTFHGIELEIGKDNYLPCNIEGMHYHAENVTEGYIYCEGCNQKVLVHLSHTEPDESEIEIIEPTTETEGKKSYTCKECGKKIEEILPKKEAA